MRNLKMKTNLPDFLLLCTHAKYEFAMDARADRPLDDLHPLR